VLRKAEGPEVFDVWIDSEIVDESREFRPEIQLGLDRSDAFLLILSPTYFNSHWCTWELATALARRRVNGEIVEWIYVDDRAEGSDAITEAKKLREISTAAETQAFLQAQLESILSKEPLWNTVLRKSTPDSDLEKIKVKLGKSFDESFDPIGPKVA
jgi:hypothetical protein